MRFDTDRLRLDRSAIALPPSLVIALAIACLPGHRYFDPVRPSPLAIALRSVPSPAYSSNRGPIMATTRNRNARRMTLRDQIKLSAWSWAAGLITWQAGSIVWAATSH